METTNNEPEKAQFGAASAAGYGAPFDYLSGLKNYINLAREIASQYGVITIKNREAKAFVALFFMRQLKGAAKLLPSYIADLKQGKCMEAFCISSGLHREDLFWLWCEQICTDMEGESFCKSLNQPSQRQSFRSLMLRIPYPYSLSSPSFFLKVVFCGYTVVHHLVYEFYEFCVI